MRGPRFAFVCIALVIAGLSGACARESKVTRWRPFFSGLADAEMQTGPVHDPIAELAARPADDNRIVIEGPRGRPTLVCKSVQHVMIHVERCLDEREDALLIEQVFSQPLKDHIASLGATPEQYVDFLRENRKDIARTFGRLPFGERTPTAIFEPTGNRQYVLRLTGQARKGLRFTRVWVALEGGDFKLLWIS